MFESISQLSVKHIKVIMIRRRVLGGVKMMMIMMIMMMMTVISVSSEAAVEELRRLLLLLLGSAVQVITRSYDRHALVKADHSSIVHVT